MVCEQFATPHTTLAHKYTPKNKQVHAHIAQCLKQAPCLCVFDLRTRQVALDEVRLARLMHGAKVIILADVVGIKLEKPGADAKVQMETGHIHIHSEQVATRQQHKHTLTILPSQRQAVTLVVFETHALHGVIRGCNIRRMMIGPARSQCQWRRTHARAAHATFLEPPRWWPWPAVDGG